MKMIPAGYMAKRVAARPEWLKAPAVQDVYSVSACVSDDFADYISLWRHNGYWLFDSPGIIEAVAREQAIDLSGTQLFYYEVHALEFHEEQRQWHPFDPESSLETDVIIPREKYLQGYDVVTFSSETNPECSPLSCNALAKEIETNRHCLLDSFDRAMEMLEGGSFNDAEPGPYRIFAVYSLEKPCPESTWNENLPAPT